MLDDATAWLLWLWAMTSAAMVFVGMWWEEA